MDLRSPTHSNNQVALREQVDEKGSENNGSKHSLLNTQVAIDPLLQSISISKEMCTICLQHGKCIGIHVMYQKSNEYRKLNICEFCYRKVLFRGIDNVLPKDFGWDITICNSCGKKRLKSSNETRFCNCSERAGFEELNQTNT